MDIEWNPLARALLHDLMSKGPPEAFRESASAAILQESERGARARGVGTVEIEDVARACLRVAPPAFRPRVEKSLVSHGLDPLRFEAAPVAPARQSDPGKKEEDGFDSEWDRVHARIVGHREEVARIYGLKKAPGPLRVLDMACGTGKHLIEFARDGHRCSGVDQQDWKLAKATEQARALGLDISFTVADLRTLELQQQFDLVVCLYAMSTMTTGDDSLAAVRSAARHLSKDGVFVFNVINKEANSEPNAPMYRSVHVDRHLRDYTQGEVTELLRQAGLTLRTAEFSDVMGVKALDLFIAATHEGSTDGK